MATTVVAFWAAMREKVPVLQPKSQTIDHGTRVGHASDKICLLCLLALRVREVMGII